MNEWIALALVVLLILANGFFVAAEFALVAIDRSRVDTEAAAGRRRARLTASLLKRLSFHLSGAQLGITLTSLLIGLLAEPAIASLLEAPLGRFIGEGAVRGVSLVVAIALATIVQMVIGELVPKGLAIARPETTAYIVAPAVSIYGVVFGPLIRFLDGSANRTVRLMGVEPAEELSHVQTLPELALVVSASAEEGTLADGASRLLARSIRFESKSAEDILVPRTAVKALQRDDSVDALIELSVRTGHSRFPVYGEDLDDVIGTVHVRAVHGVPRDRRSIVRVGQLVRPPVVVPESREVGDVLVDLKSSNAHLAIVVDEYGGTAGIITLEDIVEEIVGEIGDEHDPGRPVQASSPSAGQWTLPGTLHRDELAEQVGCNVPDGEYETIAGFVLDRLGRIPVGGESIEFEGWTFTVAEMDRRRIATMRVTAPPVTDDPAVEGDR